MNRSEQQAELIADEINESIENVAEIKHKVSEIVKQRRSFGKTLEQWEKHLLLKIDPNADPAKVKYYSSQIAASIQTAYDNLAKTKIMYAQYKLSYVPAVNQKVGFQANNRGRKVAPALETMIRVAENDLGDRSLLPIEYEAFIDFWQDMVYKLKDLANIIKTIAIANGTQYKIGEFNGEL